MKYKTIKALPWIKVGTVFEYNKDIITGQYWVTLVEWDAIWWLLDFINWFGIDNDFFEKVDEKRKAVPDYDEEYWSVCGSWEILITKNVNNDLDIKYINQWNWKWTEEEAVLEIKKRAAIERVRRYIVENDLLEEDKDKPYNNVRFAYWKLQTYPVSGDFIYYSPYSHLKDTDLTQFIEDCREDLLIIHS